MSIPHSSEKTIEARSRIRELIAERKTRMIDGKNNNIEAHRLTLDEIKNIREENKKSIEERYKIIENERNYINIRRERREQKRLERLQQQQKHQQQQQIQLQEPNTGNENVEDTYSEINPIDLINVGLKFGFRPQPELIQTHNMKVTHISSMLDSQLIDINGKIFHISDHLYGTGTNKSILFWDELSFIRTLISPFTNPCKLFHLKLNLKIPSFHNTNGPLNCFQHTSLQNKNILHVTFNIDNLVITFFDNIIQLDYFSRGGISSYDIEIKCIYSESNYICSCEMKQDDDVQHRIEKDFKMDNVFMMDESCIEIGKGVMFLRNIEYYIS
jgi:hypothetical protein